MLMARFIDQTDDLLDSFMLLLFMLVLRTSVDGMTLNVFWCCDVHELLPLSEKWEFR